MQEHNYTTLGRLTPRSGALLGVAGGLLSVVAAAIEDPDLMRGPVRETAIGVAIGVTAACVATSVGAYAARYLDRAIRSTQSRL